MIKCILIYLWIYIGLFYMIEAGDDDEHVHIKLHMTSGQRKRAQIKQHHKKRHSPAPSGSHHHHHTHPHPQPPPAPPPPPPGTTTNIYHESPHNYLAGITSTSSSLVPQQHHVFEHTAGHSIKKFPSSSTPLHLHESGQLLNMDEELYDQGDGGGGGDDVEAGAPMLIPSYLAKTFASFPQPTTTYETEIIPHNSEGFNVVDGLDDLEEDNEITAPTGRGAGSLESIILAEQMENYQRHKPPSSSSAKTIKNEQLLQQLLQQHHNYNDKPEIINAAAYKSAKLRGNKYRAEKDYHSEDDMTEAIVYSSGHHPTHTFNRPIVEEPYSGSIKTLTVDDIWSQLQQQYLSKYTPQAQSLISTDSEEQQPLVTTATATKTQTKRKRNTKRHKHAKPTTTAASYTTSWPAKALSYSSSNHQKHQPKHHHQHYYDDIHSSPSASAFSSGDSSLPSSHRNTDLFAKRPFNKFTAHDDEDDTDETDEDGAASFGEEGDEDVDVFGDNADNNHDESIEEVIYQRDKKHAGHAAYGQHSHTNNPFNYHDLFGSYTTPVTATVATKLQPSTYHPNLVSSTLPAYTASSTSAFLPTISHPSTSYQWRTQQNYPASYQTYLLQHQQQQPHWTAAAATTTGEEPYAQQQQHPQQQTSVLRLPKATITHTYNTVSSSKLLPTQSNDFTVSSSSSSLSSSPSTSPSSSSAKSTAQTPTRYKKRKNRIKSKRNRIVVL